MITNLMIMGRFDIGVNSKNAICIDNKFINIEKEIPIVRYRFKDYSEDDLQYITNNMKKFKASAHLVEIELSEKTAEQHKLFGDAMQGNLKVAKFLRIEVDDKDMSEGCLVDSKLQQLESVKSLYFDRYILVDKTTFLDYINTKRLISYVSKFMGVREGDVGICGCASSFGGDQCLSAVKAREIMSIYTNIGSNEAIKIALPTANHEDMSNCGCIRHMIIESDIKIKENGAQKVAGGKSEFMNVPEAVSKKKVTAKKAITPGKFRF